MVRAGFDEMTFEQRFGGGGRVSAWSSWGPLLAEGPVCAKALSQEGTQRVQRKI